MSLAQFFILFGEKEMALGSTYVTLSRAVALEGIYTRDMLTLKRLMGLSLSDRADLRRAFDIACDRRAIATMESLRDGGVGGQTLVDAMAAAIAAAKAQLALDEAAHIRRITDKDEQAKAAIDRARAAKKARTNRTN